MRNGYKVYWTDNAIQELKETIEYLERNFTDKEISKLALKIEGITELISQNPKIFPKSEVRNVYKAVVLKFNTLYYRINKENVEILSFFSNRQNSNKRKI